ncbi:hypothetical protein [Mycolicibacterium sarraceniae]|uniref:hypothetical protein n=1 Tax=Mycolicibacterium sarraceniae TaxID=1534348 RepID=UPI001F1C2F13|nr:hypothetical protein [Mycolicibacterium sarraceniae]
MPSLAWVPLLLLWFGIGEEPQVFLVAIGAFLPVYPTASALAHVDPHLVAAELIASSKGLGFRLIDSQNTGRTDVMISAFSLFEHRVARARATS